jgi:hypothetical protein
MNTLAIFGAQLALSLFVYTLLAKWYVAPWLAFLADGVAEQSLPRTLAGAGLDLQCCGHSRPSKRTKPRGGCTQFGSDLVHTNILCAHTLGSAHHDICPDSYTVAGTDCCFG